MKQRYILLLFTLFLGIFAYAEDVVFQASAPKQVVVGKPFQLTYSVNQRSRDFQAPDFGNFNHLAGPFTSQSSSTSFVNGKRTSSFTQTYTFTLMAMEEGTYTIAPARIKVSGDEYTSNSVKITVLPPDQTPANNPNQSANQGQSQAQNQGQGQSQGGDIFIRTIVSKTNVCEQEALLLSYRLYFAGVDVAQFTNNTKLPDFTGFLKQEVSLGEVQTELEHYNGRNYQAATLYQTLLFPQHEGDIKIDPASFEAVLRVQSRAQVRSIFDDFFGSYTNVTKPLVAPAVTIHVNALPKGKPANFSGGVGRFNISSTISAEEVDANEAITLHLDIEGNGNMKLLKTPAIDWPEGFEAYDPKVTNNFKTTANGVSGKKSIDYLAIPRAGGEYTIPAITFSYYDTAEKTYKILSTPAYTIKVRKNTTENSDGAVVNNYVNKESIKQLGEDIRFIHTDPEKATVQTSRLDDALRFNAQNIGLYFALPFVLALLLLVIFRRRIKENADKARVRYKKAKKNAMKLLKTDAGAALLTYLSDRLRIPTAELSKDNIADILRQKAVNEELIKETVQILSEIDFARYAPAETKGTIANEVEKLINQLEDCDL